MTVHKEDYFEFKLKMTLEQVTLLCINEFFALYCK